MSPRCTNAMTTDSNSMGINLFVVELWRSGDLEEKRSIQKMEFPDGILYDFENDNYRTTRVNSIYKVIPSLSNEKRAIKNGNKVDLLLHSRVVARGGLEPSTSAL